MLVNPYFAGHPVTFTLVVTTVLAWVALDLAQGLRHRGDGRRVDRGSYFLLLACVFLVCFLALLSTAIPGGRVAGQPLPFVVGLVVAWGGIVLRTAAFRALGRDFTFRVRTRPDQLVISTGPYRVLRHPGYSAIWLILLGLALMCGTWIAVVAAVVLPAIGFAFRIRIEERALETDLGESYVSFAATRKRLIPFLW